MITSLKPPPLARSLLAARRLRRELAQGLLRRPVSNYVPPPTEPATEPLRANEQVFYHSGDLGDVIYSLPTMKALGGGVLYLGPDSYSRMPTREAMTQPRAQLMLRLLRAQPYIKAAGYRDRAQPCHVNLNLFREEMVHGVQLDLEPGYNLARVPLKHWHLPLDLDKVPWLTAPPRRLAPVVIARSPRYHNRHFDWARIIRNYTGSIVFIGTTDEHLAFCQSFGFVPYSPTADLYEAACIIAGADLFIGNQSCPLAIAIGLGKQVIIEECPTASNCIFDRPNFIRGTRGVHALPKVHTDPITIAAPVENFTGYGQLIHAICVGLHDQGIDFRVQAFSYSDDLVPVEASVRSRIVPSPVRYGLIVSPLPEVHERLCDGEVLFTMWESTRIDAKTIEAINKRAAALIVPSQWNASCFSAAGVDRPIRVVPLGVDPEVYHYTEPAPSKVFRFGTAGRLAHAGPRKGVEDTIECFMRAFQYECDVELQIKIFGDCQLDQPKDDKRIIVHRRFMPTLELVEWYASLNCLVAMSKGEGWGLHLHQSMAVGRPVIAPRQGGQAEFVTEENSYCCRYKLEPSQWSVYNGQGHWCIPDKDHCIELMRHAYTHRDEVADLGRRASQSVGQFTWSRTVNELIAVLKEFGKL